MVFPALDAFIGNTPLVKLQRLAGSTDNTLLAKLEGNNPAGSSKDRAALNMIRCAEERGEITFGDRLIEATSGNTGIASAMVAAIRGYKITLVMPDNMSAERRTSMAAYGADIILTPADDGMEGAIDLAKTMASEGKGKLLDQFANPDNANAHYIGTGPEIWRDTHGSITHLVCAMGTTGTLMGCSRFLKAQNPDIQVIGVQPDNEAAIPGIRRWPKNYLPKIFDSRQVDRIIEVSQFSAESTMRRMAIEEGLFAGVSSGAAMTAVLQLDAEISDAVIVCVICDRGDRYLSTGVYNGSL